MTEIKICGFTRREDIEKSIQLGIRIIGINFYDKSPRFVPPLMAKHLLASLPEDVDRIGVFVNPGEEELLRAVESLDLSGIQLHGDEPPSLLEEIRRRAPAISIIKAVRVKSRETLASAIRIHQPDYLLLDAYDEKQEGGTGKRIDIGYLQGVAIDWKRVFLAGGIGPDNAGRVIRLFRPYGIDSASGVESKPGIKDLEKVRRLIEVSHKADRDMQS